MTQSSTPFWSREKNDLLERWNKTEDGSYEKPVLLTHLPGTPGEVGRICEMLRAYDIPVMTRSAGDGAFGQLMLGYSGTGVDLYVPESLLEDAKNLLAPMDEAEWAKLSDE